MSDHGMHVHGPHDDALEHAAEGSIDSFSGKQNLAAVAIELAPESKRAYFENEAKRQEAEMNSLKGVAQGLDAQAIALDAASDEQLRRHHRWSQAWMQI